MQVQVQPQSFEDRRSEPREEGLIERATLYFRGQPYPVPVVNISSRGTMVESDIVPRLGETVLVEFPECSRIHAFVRWARDGRLGLNFGHEIVIGG
ncbi:MAG TPA: PilZ domain-containing protein [Allosphingosinicella sp.]|nr:PilZ domain-containing protein [Allosphingosinicella sp.]